MAIKISNAFITKLQMVSDTKFNTIEDFTGTAAIISGSTISVGGGGGLSAVLWYDASDTNSYPGTGTTIYNIGSDGNASGTTGTLSGVSFDGTTASGILDFDGGSDRIVFPSYDFGNQITVTAWVYPRSEASINTLLSNASAGLNTNGFKLEWNNWNTSDLKMLIEAGNGSSGNIYTADSATIVLDEWQMISYVIDFSNQTATLYRNGSSVAASGTIVSGINTSATWNIGSMMGSYFMNAKLGELKVFKSNLSSSDISAEFDNTKSRYGL